MPRKILIVYYAATALFLLLDYGLDINVRIAFFAGNSEAKAAYYFVLFVCFAEVLWRPAWSTVIGGIESLATIVLLIAGGAAYVSFQQGLRSLVGGPLGPKV